eukprot:CAMPEP_0174878884 /NCGR_PEP_ID=MMETSP1114-20130205/82982_1 /TAXON_ID=312471 /ORGANISM="Neobodo designis, Strain CCAP 1951/1" /LENGTH=540 /DNA_ID=CAMNT_0016114273 /DNA_START=70 /DNA_END=1692 /DNA_ORIENTATION=-
MFGGLLPEVSLWSLVVTIVTSAAAGALLMLGATWLVLKAFAGHNRVARTLGTDKTLKAPAARSPKSARPPVLVLADEPSEQVRDFKVSSEGRILARVEPNHCLHKDTLCELRLEKGVLQVRLMPKSRRPSSSSSGSRTPQSTRARSPASSACSSRGGSRSTTPVPEGDGDPLHQGGASKAKPKADDGSKVVSISLDFARAFLDSADRTVLHVVPRPRADAESSKDASLCDVEYSVMGKVRIVSWTKLSLRFKENAREADRWFSLLSAAPCTDRWVKFVRKIPKEGLTAFNVMLARVLIENSSGPILDDFIAAKLRRELTSVEMPPPLGGTVKLIAVRSGDDAPLFTNAEFRGLMPTGEFEFDFDVHYSGGFQLELDVGAKIGPISVPSMRLEFTITKIKGRLRMSVGIPPSNKMWVGFHDQPELGLELKQDVNVPSDLIASPFEQDVGRVPRSARARARTEAGRQRAFGPDRLRDPRDGHQQHGDGPHPEQALRGHDPPGDGRPGVAGPRAVAARNAPEDRGRDDADIAEDLDQLLAVTM